MTIPKDIKFSIFIKEKSILILPNIEIQLWEKV